MNLLGKMDSWQEEIDDLQLSQVAEMVEMNHFMTELTLSQTLELFYVDMMESEVGDFKLKLCDEIDSGLEPHEQCASLFINVILTW